MSLWLSGDAYDAFMGRYSRRLAVEFAAFAGVAPGLRALDVGCGPGALTGELLRRLGAGNVAACEPSEPFAAACAARYPGVDVRHGRAEQIPFGDGEFDLVAAQLVLHFVSDPVRARTEFVRVAAPGATIAACVWDFTEGMELLRAFWDAASSLDPEMPGRSFRFGRPGEIAQWLADAGLEQVAEGTLAVESEYRDFGELWASVRTGTGPAGAHCVGLPQPAQDRLRRALFDRLGAPPGAFRLTAVARAARGVRAAPRR
ncbi:MAG: class I SAM-dependent methyltransferase [Micropruina sp.]|uniref:class I SAM-dependent methyltransferase n=1 Tax=Micropruina sp. TaxID=2737536 RepID=UPI0039E36F16